MVVVSPSVELKKIEEIPVSNYCYSVCESGGVTYVGVRGGVNSIRSNSNASNRHISLDGFISSVCAYKDRLYLLHYNNDQWSVLVYGTDGRRQLHKWFHKDIINTYNNGLAIYNDCIYVPDRFSSRITVYTLFGKVVTYYDCKLDSYDFTVLTVTSSGCIVISQWHTGVISCISIDTRQELWTHQLDKLTAMTCDARRGFIYVATGDWSKALNLKVLSPDKGY